VIDLVRASRLMILNRALVHFCLSNFCFNSVPTFSLWCWIKNVRAISFMFSLSQANSGLPSSLAGSSTTKTISKVGDRIEFRTSPDIPVSLPTNVLGFRTYYFIKTFWIVSVHKHLPCLPWARLLIDMIDFSNKGRQLNVVWWFPPELRRVTMIVSFTPAYIW